jgi:tetratricopeptide (TPR) repeat protein
LEFFTAGEIMDFALASDPRLKYALLAALIITSFALNWGTQEARNWFDKGMERASAKDMHGAIAYFDKALELNPRMAEAYANRGAMKGKLGDYEGAAADLSMAVKLKPALASAWFNLGGAKYRLGDIQSAGEDFDKAHQIDPNVFPDAWTQLDRMKGQAG